MNPMNLINDMLDLQFDLEFCESRALHGLGTVGAVAPRDCVDVNVRKAEQIANVAQDLANGMSAQDLIDALDALGLDELTERLNEVIFEMAEENLKDKAYWD